MTKLIRNQELDEQGHQYYLYNYKGKDCPTMILSGPLVDQFSAYGLIYDDLNDAISIMKQFLETYKKEHTEDIVDEKQKNRPSSNEQSDLLQGLFVASITFYAKCFAIKSKRKVSLRKEKNVPKEFYELHDYVMDLRDSFAAHAGHINNAPTQGSGYVNIVLPPESCEGVDFFIEPVINRIGYIDCMHEKCDVKVLFEAVLSQVNNKCVLLNKKIIEEEVKTKEIQYWYEQAKEKKLTTNEKNVRLPRME